jgi:hypothetical protein
MGTHLVGFHIQESPPGWPGPVAMLPKYTIIKMTSAWERLIEAKAHNPGILGWARHVTDQPMPTGDYDKVAREIFARFVDPGAKWTHHVNLVQAWNEFYADSQQPEERRHWTQLDIACARVWDLEYRKKYAHLKDVRFVMGEAAVGNDLPLTREYAEAAHKHGAVLGYHPYMLIRRGAIDKGDWLHHSGRWVRMDKAYRDLGYKLPWAFGEMGPHESAHDGWQSVECLNGSMPAYLDALTYWCDNVVETVAYKEGRVLGGVLFTCGAPKGGPDWSKFELHTADMERIASFAAQYQAPEPEPLPPPKPPQDKPRGAPRVQYARQVWVAPKSFTEAEFTALAKRAYAGRHTLGFSYDDAGVGDLDSRTAVLWNVHGSEQFAMRTWYRDHYPGVEIEFRDLYAQPAVNIEYIVHELPVHKTRKYKQRDLAKVRWLVVHHTVSPPDRPIEQIAAYHVDKNGWPGIGYHFVIGDRGETYQTNDLTTQSYHCGVWGNDVDENEVSIGIALQGDFTKFAPPEAQLAALRALIAYLRGTFSGLELLGHKDVPGAQTACPGATWTRWQEELK